MPNEFDKLAEKAAKLADEEFQDRFSSLTRLTDRDTDEIINETGISQQDLAHVLQAVKDATASNEAKANSIQQIDNGVSALVAIVKRFI